ncbi:hypothetical protein BX666DRAFT_1850228 [Dichotomocladium elegans]|nr:hypothetical protein BX666DRAFT_1850228 [Dichotomocladium elegans]
MDSKHHHHNHHHHHPENLETRDPIMTDDHFSLRYDNPIQVIHDAPKPETLDLEPSKTHIPIPLTGAVTSTPNLKPPKSTPLKKLPSFERDTTTFAEFVHHGSCVDEIDH